VFLLFLHLLCNFNFLDHPDSVDVTINNQLGTRNITSASYILPNSDHLSTVHLPHPLLPENTMTVRVPYGYINRLIFETEDGTVYTTNGYPASTNPETISISLADKEFGGLFERIYGIYPVAVRNSTDVNVVSVFLQGDSVPCTNLLRHNVLLPDEILRVWLDSGITAQLSAIDLEGNTSTPITITAPAPDTLYRITSELFFSNGNEIGYNGSSPGSWVVNCITLDDIVQVEAFSSEGLLLDGLDCSSSPLSTWDRVFVMHRIPVGYIVCTDSEDRTYSANNADSITGAFIFGDLNLDFGFGFPE